MGRKMKIEIRNKKMLLVFCMLAIAAAAAVGWSYYNRGPAEGHGVVNGIIYNDTDPSVLIGIRIVKEGEVIDDVEVVKIYVDKVEFRKNDKTWEQRIGQKANRAWKKRWYLLR